MKALLPLLAAACLAGTGAAWSADRACMIEGSFTVAGKATAMKDCMEFTAAVPADQLKGSCNGLAQMSAAMGRKPGKVTFLGGSAPARPAAPARA